MYFENVFKMYFESPGITELVGESTIQYILITTAVLTTNTIIDKSLVDTSSN